MPSQGPTAVNNYADANDSLNAWTTVTSSGGSIAIVNTGDTDTLDCEFNAGAFSIPGGSSITGVTVQFDATASTDMGGALPVVKTVKISLCSTNLSDGATLPASGTLSYGPSLFGGSPTVAQINGAWNILLAFSAVASGNQSSISISNAKATVAYSGSDDGAELIAEATATLRFPPPPARLPRLAGAYELRSPAPPGANSDTFENLQSRISTVSTQPRLLLAERAAYAVNLSPQNIDLESAETVNERTVIWNP